jgi:hypothetical protein
MNSGRVRVTRTEVPGVVYQANGEWEGHGSSPITKPTHIHCAACLVGRSSSANHDMKPHITIEQRAQRIHLTGMSSRL